MGIISKETTALLNNVRDNFPKTWEWVRYKANWERMCVGAVCEYYRFTIEKLMDEETANV
jgi:hypothetical protein